MTRDKKYQKQLSKLVSAVLRRPWLRFFHFRFKFRSQWIRRRVWRWRLWHFPNLWSTIVLWSEAESELHRFIAASTPLRRSGALPPRTTLSSLSVLGFVWLWPPRFIFFF